MIKGRNEPLMDEEKRVTGYQLYVSECNCEPGTKECKTKEIPFLRLQLEHPVGPMDSLYNRMLKCKIRSLE